MVHIVADADAMRTLATARSVAVKDYLAERELPQERLFLGSARVEETPAAGSPAMQPGVLLSLTHP
jgi:hypothetical protein